MIIPIIIASLAGLAFWKASSDKTPEKGTITPDRQAIFEAALNDLKDPAKLRAMAQVYRREGLEAYADLLEKRAALRELPDDVKDARKDAFQKGMSSDDPAAVAKLATAFEKEGATGAATALRKYADGLQKGVILPGQPGYIGPGIRQDIPVGPGGISPDLRKDIPVGPGGISPDLIHSPEVLAAVNLASTSPELLAAANLASTVASAQSGTSVSPEVLAAANLTSAVNSALAGAPLAGGGREIPPEVVASGIPVSPESLAATNAYLKLMNQ